MVQLQNFLFFSIFLVVLCGTAAPILFQWLVSRDVSTGAPFSNGTVIPISTSLLLVLVLIHSRGFMRSLDEAKRIVSMRARPLLLPNIIERSSPEKIQYISSFLDEKALSIPSFFRQSFPPLLVIQSPAALVGQYFGFVVSDKTKSGSLADSVRALRRALLLFSYFTIIKFMGDFSYLESFCGVLCFFLFRTFLLSSHHRRDRLARHKFPFFVFHRQRRRKLIISSLRRNNLNWSRCFLVRALPSRPMTVGYYFRKAPVNMKLSHGGVCIFIMGVILPNAKKIQSTGKTPLGSELHMGKVRSTLRGIDQLHGPTFHSICGNSIIYKPSLTNPLMFEHDESRPALLQSWPTEGAKLSTDGRGFSSPPTGGGNFCGSPKGRGPEMAGRFTHTSLRKKGFTVLEHNSFSHWLTMFPEKRFYFSNQETSTTKVAIHTNLFTDLYALIGTGSFETGGWYTTVIKLPFIFRIWIGFVMASLGGSLSLFRRLTFYRLDWN
uniref:Cytochrome c biogenesis factor C n=1 Tax=Calypogeia suecica TaxID=373805 RepID=A0A286SDZ2_9MARC|nr:cytochrome c biogenesis factor C [Calypogeia suecica]ASZ80328.1 cytochrome c biogenesis factor C [Calypogeia suecica]WCP19045.1 cytochrome c biogenesis factor C [Calypogeia suecica]WCP19087.1 cytochrome c biogenesis factor C [Calypogeia suecica]